MADLALAAIEGVRSQGMRRLASLWAEGDAAMERHDALGVMLAIDRRNALRRMVAGEVTGEPLYPEGMSAEQVERRLKGRTP